MTMPNQYWNSPDGVRFLNGIDYTMWKVRMGIYLKALGVDVEDAKKNKCNTKAKEAILSGLSI